MIVKLSSKARFRREVGWIFLCDLRTLRDFEVPEKYWNLLERLRCGLDPERLTPDEQRLVSDLETLELTCEGEVSPKIWSTLEFE
jgi:hypothetical protein